MYYNLFISDSFRRNFTVAQQVSHDLILSTLCCTGQRSISITPAKFSIILCVVKDFIEMYGWQHRNKMQAKAVMMAWELHDGTGKKWAYNNHNMHNPIIEKGGVYTVMVFTFASYPPTRPWNPTITNLLRSPERGIYKPFRHGLWIDVPILYTISSQSR